MTLSAPSVVQESIGTFMANISVLLATSAITLPLEIDISDTGFTATRNG